MFHFRNVDYRERWKAAFGWHQCYEFPDQWDKLEGNICKNKKTGEISENGQFTDHPELCVTNYACKAWDDDYADCGVVALFEPEKLAALSPGKLAAIKDISTITKNP